MTNTELKNLKSWINVREASHFPVYNLPFGVFMVKNEFITCGTRIGDMVIDFNALQQLGYLNELKLPEGIFLNNNLNAFIELGKSVHKNFRNRLLQIFAGFDDSLLNHAEHKSHVLMALSDVEMQMPVFVPDYTDFYSSKEHATNVGIMFRGAENALMPNWLHMPIGYHGRSSSIIVSGVDIHRPHGQILTPENEVVFSASRQMDFELEVAFITRQGKDLGHPIKASEAEDYIFGLVVFNDWSARDIQKWEYQPLGPFLGKNFASSISPWIVTLEALEPFRCYGPEPVQDQKPYLQSPGPKTFDLQLEVKLNPQDSEDEVISRSNFKYLYWNMSQQLAHHTVNGCNINAGDMLASGTISGPTENSYGSMLELAWKGTKPIKLANGQTRVFIQDYDQIAMTGYCEKDGLFLGFGEVRTTLLPAIEY